MSKIKFIFRKFAQINRKQKARKANYKKANNLVFN